MTTDIPSPGTTGPASTGPATTGPATTPRRRVLLADDSAETTELFGTLLEQRLGCEVVTLTFAGSIGALLGSTHPFDAAVVDLSFAHQDRNGLDVLVELNRRHPTTRVAVLTSGDAWALSLLRVAWDACDLATALSKTASVDHQIEAIGQVVRGLTVPVDAVLRAGLPDVRDPNRRAAGFARLVPHKGHAKLWNALLSCSPEAEYAELALLSGLTLNTIRNYRSALLPELALHGLDAPSMQQMRSFALLARPLLAPFLDDADHHHGT